MSSASKKKLSLEYLACGWSQDNYDDDKPQQPVYARAMQTLSYLFYFEPYITI